MNENHSFDLGIPEDNLESKTRMEWWGWLAWWWWWSVGDLEWTRGGWSGEAGNRDVTAETSGVRELLELCQVS